MPEGTTLPLYNLTRLVVLFKTAKHQLVRVCGTRLQIHSGFRLVRFELKEEVFSPLYCVPQ